jgi:hypothetical protein
MAHRKSHWRACSPTLLSAERVEFGSLVIHRILTVCSLTNWVFLVCMRIFESDLPKSFSVWEFNPQPHKPFDFFGFKCSRNYCHMSLTRP